MNESETLRLSDANQGSRFFVELTVYSSWENPDLGLFSDPSETLRFEIAELGVVSEVVLNVVDEMKVESPVVADELETVRFASGEQIAGDSHGRESSGCAMMCWGPIVLRPT